MGEVPEGLVTVTFTRPAPSAGAVAMIDVAELTVNESAETVPNLTTVAPVKFVPVIVTTVPPIVEPTAGETPVTEGALLAETKVNWSAGLMAEAPALYTETSTRPAASAGAVAVIDVFESTVNELAATLPKSTCVVPVKFVPVIVTTVPPAAGPEAGLRPVTVGGSFAVFG